ncbi:GntR family transcriptional regulator [Priestia endophytica]|uniref:GntR family transcriptional regulator n=1 Tax=Priestia endophytica TaxID=135735 RepID=UPI000DCA5FE7|nr:GntR family transcriptional regulator [Priestia endophytica]RAS72785.1 hypothetical protein A4R27_25575 [Priestia endophytica]
MFIEHNQSRAIRKKPLGQFIADELRQRIWQGKFQLGEKVSETELSNEMGISRSSLREALQILEHEGLVVNKARKGTFLVEFKKADIQEINELRLHIEVPAIMKTAEIIEDHQINDLEEMIQEMKRCIASEDWFGLFAVDIAFHVFLVQLCGNSRMIRVYSIMQNQIRTVLSQLVNYYEVHKYEFCEEHEALLKAIKTRNSLKVQEVAISHINHIYHQITSTL